MGRFVVGQVVSSTFPFSDLTTHKLRPAVVAAVVDHEDLILCQITSKSYSSSKALSLNSQDFKSGQLPHDSFIRPDKLFTADESIVSKVHGNLSDKKLSELKNSIQKLFT